MNFPFFGRKMAMLLLFLPLLSIGQEKKYPSLLWKISGNGLHKSSWLYGTMHVSNRVAFNLSEEFFSAIKNADVVGLETDPSKWLDNMQETGELPGINQFRNQGTGNNFYSTAFSGTFPDRKLLQAILSYDPEIINGLLYRQNRFRENFEESTYIDLFIFQAAAKLGKKVLSLEDFFQAEIKARLALLPDEKAEGESTVGLRQVNPDEIEAAYREGDLDKLDSLSRMAGTKNLQKYLIDDRNLFFACNIDSILKKESIFAGVGAAHLPGNNGVIELLRKKGYTVEPVHQHVSRKSHATRDKIDRKINKTELITRFPADSSFSADVPGQLYQVVSYDNLRYLVTTDMVNGSFYTVVRLRHLGPLYGVSPLQLAMCVDSLLYESIPGRIVRKKELNNAGYKGVEVINQLRNGNMQRYNIYFTPLEMIIFKVGGKLDYVLKPDVNRFFSSVKFTKQGMGKIEFTPPAAGFSVKIPAFHSYLSNDGSSLSGLSEDLFAFDQTSGCAYAVKQAVYNDFTYLEEDTFELNQLARNITTGYGFSLVPEYQIMDEQGFPAIRFSGKNDAGRYLGGKVYIKGVHYYLVYMIAGEKVSFDDGFFKSFRLTDFNYLNPIREIKDKDFWFRVSDEVTDDALSRFNEAYTRAYELSDIKVTEPDNGYDFRSGTRLYYSPSSKEYVNITYEKYNDYDYKSRKEIDKNISDSYGRHSGLLVTNVAVSDTGGYHYFRCILRDTATVRAIDVRVFFSGGHMLEIACPYDTTIGLKGWALQFMSTFRPQDTLIGRDIFMNKFPVLINDLCSNDTAIRKRANASLSSVTMHGDYAESFAGLLNSPKQLPLINDESRAMLFVNGGLIGNENIVVPYRKQYRQYNDSFYLQLCLLKGLAILRTQNSFAAFRDLIISDPPLIGDEDLVKNVFAPLHDSLELCSGYFPDLLKLTVYDEYRDAVYSLMAELVNADILHPDRYKSFTKSILADASLCLKRFSPGTTKSAVNGQGNDFAHLGKSAREIAESIQLNLEGLSNNNFFGDSPVLRAMRTSKRHPLVNYACILSSFHKSNLQVSDFISRIARIKDNSIVMPVAINLLKQKITLNDTLISYYSRNKNTRAYFYSELEKENLSDKFDKKYLSQESLIESLLSSRQQLKEFYNYESGKPPGDSFVLINKVSATNKYQRGDLYIYRTSPANAAGEEEWSAVFIPKSRDKVTANMELISAGYTISNKLSRQDNINLMLDNFYLGYRKRASELSFSPNADAAYHE